MILKIAILFAKLKDHSLMTLIFERQARAAKFNELNEIKMSEKDVHAIISFACFTCVITDFRKCKVINLQSRDLLFGCSYLLNIFLSQL